MTKIGVFHIQNKSWKLLPEISNFLTEKQLIPNLEEKVTAIGEDYKIMNISADSFENCLTVKEKIFHYSSYDVALVCEYIPF